MTGDEIVRVCGDVRAGRWLTYCECGLLREVERPHGYRDPDRQACENFRENWGRLQKGFDGESAAAVPDAEGSKSAQNVVGVPDPVPDTKTRPRGA